MKTFKRLLCGLISCCMVCSFGFATVTVASATGENQAEITKYFKDSTDNTAESSPYHGTLNYVDGKYSASCESAIDNNQYVLLVVEKPSNYEYGDSVTNGLTIDSNTILYIDQAEATEEGVSFTNFIPMQVTNSLVLLGGTFESGTTSPILLGELVGQGYTVRGQVKSYDPKKAATIQLVDKEDGSVVAETTIEALTEGSGQMTQTFEISSVPAGTYDLVVTKDRHLDYTVTDVVVEGDLDLTAATGKAYQTMNMRIGDINGDNMINSDDLSVLWNPQNYGKSVNGEGSTANILADLDGSGAINSDDLSVLWNPQNYGKGLSNSTYSYAE